MSIFNKVKHIFLHKFKLPKLLVYGHANEAIITSNADTEQAGNADY